MGDEEPYPPLPNYTLPVWISYNFSAPPQTTSSSPAVVRWLWTPARPAPRLSDATFWSLIGFLVCVSLVFMILAVMAAL